MRTAIYFLLVLTAVLAVACAIAYILRKNRGGKISSSTRRAGRSLTSLRPPSHNSHRGQAAPEADSQCDYLTGLLNRRDGESSIAKAMRSSRGALAFVDLDNLKPINDTLGHMAGDHALRTLAGVLQSCSRGAIITRVGGDEFLYYMNGVNEKEARAIIEGILYSFRSKRDEDELLKVSSLSIGVYLTRPADSYQDAYQKADKALYYVKQNGKDGYYFYNSAMHRRDTPAPVDLKRLVSSISRQGAYKGALGVEYREFAKFYEYINNLVGRYDQDLQLVMLTMEPVRPDSFTPGEQEKAMEVMGGAINSRLRSVDVSTRFSSRQYLIILLDADSDSIDKIMLRIFDRFHELYEKDDILLNYDVADLPVQNLPVTIE